MSLLYFYPNPKPKTFSKLVDGIRIFPDGREVCETPEAWNRRREEVFLRERCRCQGCKRVTPLHDRKDEQGDVIADAGHADHIIPRGMKGAKRDDRPPNLRWLCNWCHRRRHEPAKVCPKKVMA